MTFNFNINGIKVRGWSTSNPVQMSGVTIYNCKFFNNAGRAIEIQYAANCNVSNCEIIQELDVDAETDGIFFNDSCDNISIGDNYVRIKNDSYNSSYHVDGIQVSEGFNPSIGRFSSNVSIVGNTVISNSNVGAVDRSVLMITGIANNLSIINNCLISETAQDLINMTTATSSGIVTNAVILNNTIASRNNVDHLMFVKNLQTLSSPNITFQIMNNIFYNSGVTTSAIDFENINSSYLSSTSLNYNLYYNTSSTPTLIFYDGAENWNFNGASGVTNDPLFTSFSSDDLTLQYNSPAINAGTFLIDYDHNSHKRPYWVGGSDIGAYEFSEAQLRIGHQDAQGSIIHHITALGTYWEKSGSSWNISSDPQLASGSYTVSDNNPDMKAWDGFRFKWMLNPNEERPMGHAFYKVSNPYTFFYLDLRDVTTEYNPNIYLAYDGTNLQYKYKDVNGIFQLIETGTILRVWDIEGVTVNEIILPDYINNMLINLEESNHPKLVWGPVNANSVDVLRNNGTEWSIIGPSISGSVLSYLDETVDIAITEDEETALINYFVRKGTCTECSSNVVDYYVTHTPEKKNLYSEIEKPGYSLLQNYPNPFNPNTSIQFSIAQADKVVIKIYDLLGKEIETVMDHILQPGKYKVDYNGNKLASGIYFYSISSGTFNKINKMQLIK